jgi:hypothetical protein
MSKVSTPRFSTSQEAVAASAEGFFLLTEVVNSHDNWAYLFERCGAVRRYPEGYAVFIGPGWYVRLLARKSAP